MKRYFGSRGGGPMHAGRYWYWDTELDRGFWVDADGSNVEESGFTPDRWLAQLPHHYMELPGLPCTDTDLLMDEGL